MEWFRQLSRAIRNLARMTRQNPVWAITAFVFSPVKLIRHLIGVIVLLLASGIVLAGGATAASYLRPDLHVRVEIEALGRVDLRVGAA